MKQEQATAEIGTEAPAGLYDECSRVHPTLVSAALVQAGWAREWSSHRARLGNMSGPEFLVSDSHFAILPPV